MKRGAWWLLIVGALLIVFVRWCRPAPVVRENPAASEPVRSQPPLAPGSSPTAGERLMEGYGDPAVEPVEDLRKLHRVMSGYFSVIKDPSRFPIGGNEDFAAALKGENANREVFLKADHPVFSKDGRLMDRWGTPLVVHPEGWRRIELRSAGPDRIPYNADDLVISASGVRRE